HPFGDDVWRRFRPRQGNETGARVVNADRSECEAVRSNGDGDQPRRVAGPRSTGEYSLNTAYGIEDLKRLHLLDQLRPLSKLTRVRILQRAVARAAVAADGVAVVTLLVGLDDAVAAGLCARDRREDQQPAGGQHAGEAARDPVSHHRT